jgi:hypothetical protein
VVEPLDPERFNYFSIPVTGLGRLKDLHRGKPAIILCSGVTIEDYDDAVFDKRIPRFAVNGAIQANPGADFWVFSDEAAVHKFIKFPSAGTKLISFGASIKVLDGLDVAQDVFTALARTEQKDYPNPAEFFVRTSLVACLESARYMGIRDYFFFGADFFRTKKKYYFNGSAAPSSISERKCYPARRIKNAMLSGGRLIYRTPMLSTIAGYLDSYAKWRTDSSFYCVGSPYSQCSLDKISAEKAASFRIEFGDEQDENPQ